MVRSKSNKQFRVHICLKNSSVFASLQQIDFQIINLSEISISSKIAL